jgi:acetylglutamate kinase
VNAETPENAARAELAPQEAVLRFLECTGRPSEARLYVDLFRARPREQFAAIAIDAHVVAEAAAGVAQDLRFLAALDLFPTVVLGLFQPADAELHAASLCRRLEAEGVRHEVLSAASGRVAGRLEECARSSGVPLLVFPPVEGEGPEGRLDRLNAFLHELGTRKLLFLHRPGGLRQGGLLVPIVNLTTESDRLLASGELSRKETLILEHARRLCEGPAPPSFTVAVTSPLNLLRELFTVKGAGTLLRRGARITRHHGWEGVDLARLRELLASSFRRPPADSFFARTPSRVYLEEAYRGCAVLVATPLGAYLTKFAVSAEAQGEGIARDLWDAFAAESPSVFWRARPANPIGDWYAKLCDGLERLSDWTIYWKGVPPASIPSVIDFTLAQPIDVPRDGR